MALNLKQRLEKLDKEDLRKLCLFLHQSFNPELFSFPIFEFRAYMKEALEYLGQIYEVPNIILRTKDRTYPTDFLVFSTHGVSENKAMKEARVVSLIEHQMVKDLEKITKGDYPENHVYLKDLQNPKVGYDQKDLAKEINADSLLAAPIISDENKMDGFFVLFREDRKGFEDRTEREVIFSDIVIPYFQYVFSFADSMYYVNRHFDKGERMEHHVNQLGEKDLEIQRLANMSSFAAREHFLEGEFTIAGKLFYSAAENMKKISKKESKFIKDNLIQSTISCVKAGEESDARRSYKLFTNLVSKEEINENDNFYYQELYSELEKSDFRQFATEAYISKMKRYRNLWWRTKSFGKAAGYWFWGISSSYGDSWRRWAGAVLVLIGLYTVIYLPSPWSFYDGVLKFEMSDPFGDNWFTNLIISFSFSVAVFTTLGTGDISPMNWPAHLTVASQVLIGYAFLGIFVTIVSRKISRR